MLCYEATDPFAVRIAFGDVGDEGGAVDPDDGGIAWLVSRELLQTGLDRPGRRRRRPGVARARGHRRPLPAPSRPLGRGAVRAVPARRSRPSCGRPRPWCRPVPRATQLDLDDELAALLSNGGSDSPGADLRRRGAGGPAQGTPWFGASGRPLEF